MKKLLVFLLSVGLTVISGSANANDVLTRMTAQSYSLVGVSEAHKNGFTGKGQVIVVIDSGISDRHEAFSGKIIDGYCSSRVTCGNLFMKSGLDAGANRMLPGYNYLDDHGSMAGAIAAGKPNQNFPGGIAPDAQIIAINNQEGQTEGLLLAFDWIIKMKSKYNIVAVNASFGATGTGDRNLRDDQSACPKMDDLSEKIKQMHSLGIAFIAASGNGGAYSNVNYPACSEYAIGVGALTADGKITNYSDIGKEVDVLAPADVMGARAYTGYWHGGGTSSATPVVAGTVALLKQANPNATVDDIRKALGTSNVFMNDKIWGNLPVLNIPMALKAIQTNNYSNKTVQRVAQQTVFNNTEDTSKLNTKIKDLTNEVESLKKTNTELINKADVLIRELESVKKANADILKRVGIICKSKNRSSLCRSLGL